MKHIAALLVLLLSPAPAQAIELSLEENRAERGSVGYVDMQRLFVDSPDARHAKDSFEELIRQAEGRVNLRKAELLQLHRSQDALRGERDEVAASTPTFTVAAAAAPVASSSVAMAAAAPVASSASVIAATAPVAAAPSLALALPGMAPTEPIAAAPPAAAKPPAPVPAAAPAPAAPQARKSLLELDAKIASIQAEITRKEGELTSERDEADRGLLDVESRKTDQVLARLYRAITEVARREGVSVVVDKTTILYGHPAVDITDKVLKHLKETPQP